MQGFNETTLTVVAIVGGIISVILPDGNIGQYRQTGITELSKVNQERAIREGQLDRRAFMLPEIPKYIKLEYEDPEVMGRPSRRFKLV